MIEHADVDECQRGFQSLRDELIRCARFSNAGRVVVRVMCPRLFCGADRLQR